MTKVKGRLDNIKNKQSQARRTKKRLAGVQKVVTEKQTLGHDVRKAPPREPKRDWEAIKLRYVRGYEEVNSTTGEIITIYPSAADLAKQYDVSPVTVSYHCANEHWVNLRAEWQEGVRKAKLEAELKVIRDAEIRIRRKSLMAAEKIIDRVGSTVKVKNAAGEEKEMNLVDAMDPKDLGSIGNALRRGQEVANVAIGIPKDGVKPESEDPAQHGPQQLTIWQQMRASRQQILVIATSTT